MPTPFRRPAKALGFALFVALFAAGCKEERLSDAPVPAAEPASPASARSGFDPVLKTVSPFKVGAITSGRKIREDAAHRAALTRHFNSVTAENDMKMRAMRPGATTFYWTDADDIVNFAYGNGLRVHGHALIWHESIPGWMTTYSGTATDWDNLIKTHIQTIVTRYRGKVASWDVVNEAFNYDGSLRNSLFYQKLGSDYLAKCFRWAREADPNVLLFYNDFDLESSASKLTAVKNLIDNLRSRGIAIDGVGSQTHVTIGASTGNIASVFAQLAAKNVQAHLSELDVRTNSSSSTFTAQLAYDQRVKVKEIVAAYKSNTSTANQFGITMWGIRDNESWINSFFGGTYWPLLMDENYAEKPSYYGFQEGVGYVEENFDKGTAAGTSPLGWTLSTTGGSATVAAVPGTTNLSLYLNDNNATADVKAARSFAAKSGTVQLEYRFMVPAKADLCNVNVRSGVTTAVQVGTANGGNLAYRSASGSYVTMQGYNANTWYTVKIVVNTSTDKCDIYVDGVKRADQVGLRNGVTVNNLDNLSFDTPAAGSGSYYVDYLEVWQ